MNPVLITIQNRSPPLRGSAAPATNGPMHRCRGPTSHSRRERERGERARGTPHLRHGAARRCRCNALRSCERRRPREQFATYPPFSPRLLPPPPPHLLHHHHHHPPSLPPSLPPIHKTHTGKDINCHQNLLLFPLCAPLHPSSERRAGERFVSLAPLSSLARRSDRGRGRAAGAGRKKSRRADYNKRTDKGILQRRQEVRTIRSLSRSVVGSCSDSVRAFRLFLDSRFARLF
jgi:hypothetical protein